MPVDISQGLQPTSRDPNALIRLNMAQMRDAYLPTGAQDWSKFSLDTPNPDQGLTRPVKVVRGLLNNGNEIWVALDEKNQPIWTTSLGDVASVDEKQQSIWNQTGPKPLPPSAAPTQRQPDGTINAYNPTTGQYDTPTGMTTTVGPPGGKPFIDDGPEVGPSGRRWGWDQTANNGHGGYTRDLGSSPSAQLPTTSSARKPVDGHPGAFEVTTTDATTKKTETHYEDANGTTIQQPQDVKTQVVDDGRGGKIAIVSKPDGTFTTAPVPGVQAPPQILTVNGTSYQLQPDGTSYAPAKGIPQAGGGFVDETTAPPLATDPGKITAGLQAYSQWLNSQVTTWKASGGKQGVSPTDATAAMDRRLGVAKSVLDEQSGLTNTQAGQRGQDITERGQTLTDTASRRQAAETTYNNVLNQYMPMTKFLAPGKGGDLSAAINESLQNAIAYQNQYGGLKNSPEVGTSGFPALAQARQAAMAGISQAANPQQIFAPTAAPTATQSPGQDQGATAAAEAARQQATASAAPPTAPGPVPAVNPISGQPIAVPTVPTPSALPPADEYGQTPRSAPFSGQPQVSDPTAPVTQNSPGVTVYNPQTNPGADESQIPGFLPSAPAVGTSGGTPDYGQPNMTVTPQPSGTPINLPGSPGFDPSQPLGLAPGQRPAFLPQAPTGQPYDPHSRAIALAQRLGISPEVLGQAFVNIHGMPLQVPA